MHAPMMNYKGARYGQRTPMLTKQVNCPVAAQEQKIEVACDFTECCIGKQGQFWENPFIESS